MKFKSLILDAVKPVEGNNGKIEVINNTLNDKSAEIDSIKQEISKIDQNSMQLLNQSNETKLEILKINQKINVIER